MLAIVRLLLVAPLLSGAGRVPDVFESLGPLLGGAGHEVTMTSTRTGSVPRALDQALTTRRRRKDTEVVVVHLYSGRAFLTEDVVSAVAGGTRLVGVLAGGGLPAFGARRPRWVRRVLDRFDALVAPSPYLARWAASCTTTPVTVIPNPLALDPYPYRNRSPARPRLLWLRAYHEIYAPEDAVQTVARLAPAHPDLHLTMVGDDKGRRPEVSRLVADLGLEAQVTVDGFAGPDRKAALFEDHDLFLNTSRVDNRPVSVVEAAACGLVVVSTDAGGVADLVHDGQSALLVPSGDTTAMADAVARVLGHPALAERLSAGGRAVAEQGTPERVVAAWGTLLSAVDRDRDP